MDERLLNNKQITLFYSYSHKDEKLRDRLAAHLSILRRQQIISGWYDRQITAGEEWADKIDENLESANIIILLITADFIASDFCWGIEMSRAIERHESGEARVIPIIAKPVDWGGAPFAHLQALPKDGKPVTLWQNREQAWADVAKGVRLVAEVIVAGQPFEEAPVRRSIIPGQF